MCRSQSQGGRRCPKCGSYAAAAKANGNRRAARAARRAVADHLKEVGLPETAAAVLAAPPSVLQGFIAGAGLDPAAVAGIKLPSEHAGPPPPLELLALLESERAKNAPPPPELSAEEIAVSTAETAVVSAREAIETAKTAGKSTAAPKEALRDARADLARARFDLALSRRTTEAGRDAAYAGLSERQIAAISRSLHREHAAEVSEAFAALGKLELGPPRDESIYQPGKITVDLGSDQTTEVEGRILDAGTAIWRRGSGDFLIVQQKTLGGAYIPVAAANGKDAARTKAMRIPPIMIPTRPEGAAPGSLQLQAHSALEAVALDVAGKCAEGLATNPPQQRSYLGTGTSDSIQKVTEQAGAAVFHAEVFEAGRRHRGRLRERKARAAARAAKDAALASGATPEQARAAAKAAHRRAMGTVTRGGGVIPHFDHEIPPPVLGKERYESVARSGVRAYGQHTANDYPVVAQRGGNLQAWGFSAVGGHVQTSSITALTKDASEFITKTLAQHERSAITTYTGGTYQRINAAFTGRDPNPSASVKTTVANLSSAFDKLAKRETNTEVMTVMRGTRVPSGWAGSRSEYLEQVFTVGAKIQIGKVTSCTTKPSTASGFAGSNPYMMVIRTRDGLPVKSISQHASEDEVIIPPGSDLRCVKVDHSAHIPTVYLVAEDLVAEAETPVAA